MGFVVDGLHDANNWTGFLAPARQMIYLYTPSLVHSLLRLASCSYWGNLSFSYADLKLVAPWAQFLNSKPQGYIHHRAVLWFYNIFIYLFCVHQSVLMEVREQLLGVVSLLPPCRSGLNASHQAWWWVPLPAEPSHPLLCCNSLKIIFILCVWGFCPCVRMCTMHMQSLQRPEVVAGFPGAACISSFPELWFQKIIFLILGWMTYTSTVPLIECCSY